MATMIAEYALLSFSVINSDLVLPTQKGIDKHLPILFNQYVAVAPSGSGSKLFQAAIAHDKGKLAAR
jgi:hypothetical protein